MAVGGVECAVAAAAAAVVAAASRSCTMPLIATATSPHVDRGAIHARVTNPRIDTRRRARLSSMGAQARTARRVHTTSPGALDYPPLFCSFCWRSGKDTPLNRTQVGCVLGLPLHAHQQYGGRQEQ